MINYLFIQRHLHPITGGTRGAKGIAQWEAADLVQVSRMTVRRWVHSYEVEDCIKSSMCGRHPSTISVINHPDFREEFRDYVRSSSIRKGK